MPPTEEGAPLESRLQDVQAAVSLVARGTFRDACNVVLERAQAVHRGEVQQRPPMPRRLTLDRMQASNPQKAVRLAAHTALAQLVADVWPVSTDAERVQQHRQKETPQERKARKGQRNREAQARQTAAMQAKRDRIVSSQDTVHPPFVCGEGNPECDCPPGVSCDAEECPNRVDDEPELAAMANELRFHASSTVPFHMEQNDGELLAMIDGAIRISDEIKAAATKEWNEAMNGALPACASCGVRTPERQYYRNLVAELPRYFQLQPDRAGVAASRGLTREEWCRLSEPVELVDEGGDVVCSVRPRKLVSCYAEAAEQERRPVVRGDVVPPSPPLPR